MAIGLPVRPCDTRQALSWAFGRLRRVRVAGASMGATLPAGRSVLFNPRAYDSAAPRPGDVVVLEHPDRPGMLLVKRVAGLEGADVFVLGDAPDSSTDSRHYGAVSPGRVWGRVECTFP